MALKTAASEAHSQGAAPQWIADRTCGAQSGVTINGGAFTDISRVAHSEVEACGSWAKDGVSFPLEGVRRA